MSNYTKNSCTTSITLKTIVIIGGITWGLIGLGMILGSIGNWNIINIIFGSVPVLEAVLYIIIGVAAVMMIFDCKCKKCKGEASVSSANTDKNVDENIDENKTEKSI